MATLVIAQSQSQPQAITPTPFLSTTASASLLSLSMIIAENSAESSPTAIATHTVAVGVSGFTFSPSKLQANVGDTIEWVFYPDSHSVIRAEYGFPCTPYEYVDIGRQGFYSGPQSVKAITNDLPRYRVRVNDTNPIFFYCGAPGSCYKEKMIGVINENSTETLDGQLEAAAPLTTQILPGEPFPTESDGPKSNGGSSLGSSTVISNHNSLTGGEIAGIVIGASVLLLLGGLVVFLCGRRGGIKRAYKRTSMAYHHASPPGATEPPMLPSDNYSAQPKSPTTLGWRNSRYSAFSGLYRDQTTPPAGGYFTGISPPVSPQHTGYAHQMGGMQTAYFDHRVSSIAPSIVVVEAPDTQTAPTVMPVAAPVELPTSENTGKPFLNDKEPPVVTEREL